MRNHGRLQNCQTVRVQNAPQQSVCVVHEYAVQLGIILWLHPGDSIRGRINTRWYMCCYQNLIKKKCVSHLSCSCLKELISHTRKNPCRVRRKRVHNSIRFCMLRNEKTIHQRPKNMNVKNGMWSTRNNEPHQWRVESVISPSNYKMRKHILYLLICQVVIQRQQITQQKLIGNI